MPDFQLTNEGTWFYFNDDEKQGGVCLRELPPDKAEEIEKATTKAKKRFRRGQLVEEKKQDEVKALKLIYDYCIVAWKKVSLDGQELQCNTENKMRMMNVLDFVKVVSEWLDQLTDSNKTLEEARLKNLPTTLPGKTTNLPATTANDSTKKET